MEIIEIFGILGVNFGDGDVHIFPLMNNMNNIKHHIVAWQVSVTIATKTFPSLPFQN